MLNIPATVKVINNIQPDAIPASVLCSSEPVVLKGLVKRWPIVEAANQSDAAVDAYLRQLYPGVPVQAFIGDSSIDQRFFYDQTLTAMNFGQQTTRLDQLLDDIQQAADTGVYPSYYMGSTAVDYCLPGFRQANDLALESFDPLVSIWVGNRTRISAHFDIPDNIACVAAGQRRFILFPPEQLENLYIGPLHNTPAGQPISLVDFNQPDFSRFPRFEIALQHAVVADLNPGDAIFIPGLWWHHVESTHSLNVLVNYWWRNAPEFMGSPMDALQMALLTIRDLPKQQRQVWQQWFDHYIFNPEPEQFEHIPDSAQGPLAPLDDNTARQLRMLLLQKLNR